ncbi:PIN domain nuclease [Nostoc sp.]|uniref:PIN domain nuclease n=1 Tax=Nostoc sp. TaxID=1180 RepID=UPI002FF66250
MKQNIIIDTGPLVALINNREQYHRWATKEVANLAYPFFTCEAVITEACFILRDFHGDRILTYERNLRRSKTDAEICL